MALERLILMRHGKAEERASSGKDFDRPLSPRGRAEARAAGRRLAEAGFRPDLALVSAARRAIETWEEAGAAFPGLRLETSPALFHASAAVMLQAAEAAGARALILVGHNPGMHALALELWTRGPAGQHGGGLRRGFPPAAAAVFRFEEGGAVCEAFFAPKDGEA